MINYKHSVNKQWLEARKTCLTATEAIDLLPCVRRLKKPINDATEVPEKIVRLWGAKHNSAPVDTMSYGAAARGHVFEPYAVEQYNHDRSAETMYHWDDCIIINKDKGIGYSPDATTIQQGEGWPVVIPADGEGEKYEVLEVKCYAPEKHAVSCFKTEDKLPERYQIAAAMVTDELIDKGFVYFFNPSSALYGKCFEYMRMDLEKEIEEIERVLEVYNMACELLDTDCKLGSRGLCLIKDEWDIENEYLENCNVPDFDLEV